MAPPQQKPGQSKQDYSTPDVFIAAAQRRIGIAPFAFDFAADATNTKATRYWHTGDDALSKGAVEWAEAARGGWGWLNPPFGKCPTSPGIAPWAAACAEMRAHGGKVALLVPASVGANWFRDYVDRHAFVLFLNGRLAFLPDQPTWLYPKDCVLALYSPRVPAGYEVWKWR